MEFFEACRHRRSYYEIGADSPVSDERIAEIIKETVKYAPSAFNSQSARVLLLFGERHSMLWEITREALRAVVPSERFADTDAKISSFAAGHGTVLFFEDQDVIAGLQNKFAFYKDNFPVWSNQSAGMLQFAVWTGLESEGLGASLQHYNPLIDSAVREAFGAPANWKLLAQMPFGRPIAQPQPKTFLPIEDRFKILL